MNGISSTFPTPAKDTMETSRFAGHRHFLSFFVAAFLASGVSGHANAVALLPGLVLILVTGVLDDRFNLPVAPRLAIQLLAAFLIIAIAGIRQTYLGLASDGIETAATPAPYMLIQILTGPLFLIIALAFNVGLVNAVNMSDGVDGLAGSASAAAFSGWLSLVSVLANIAWGCRRSLLQPRASVFSFSTCGIAGARRPAFSSAMAAAPCLVRPLPDLSSFLRADPPLSPFLS